MQNGDDAGQTFPQAPQLSGSESRSVHISSQHVAEVGQQAYAPQLPHSRLVLPLHARQAARHWFRSALLEHRQKALHRSGPAAQAVPTPRELSTVPAKTTPMLRSDSDRKSVV